MKRIKIPLNCDSKTERKAFLAQWAESDRVEFEKCFNTIEHNVQQLDIKLSEASRFLGVSLRPEASRVDKLWLLEEQALECVKPDMVLDWWLEALGQARCAATKYESLWPGFYGPSEQKNWLAPLLDLADWLITSAIDLEEVMGQVNDWRPTRNQFEMSETIPLG